MQSAFLDAKHALHRYITNNLLTAQGRLEGILKSPFWSWSSYVARASYLPVQNDLSSWFYILKWWQFTSDSDVVFLLSLWTWFYIVEKLQNLTSLPLSASGFLLHRATKDPTMVPRPLQLSSSQSKVPTMHHQCLWLSSQSEQPKPW
jgi:hypothetical protein